MSPEVYSDFVAVRMKGGEDILANLDPGKADLWHGVTGVSGEAGELLDCVKKHVVYGQPLNLDNLLEELGDLEFYLQAVRNTVGISREEILQANIAKLQKRFPVGYTDAAAKERADKA